MVDEPRMVTGRFLIVTLATFCYFLSLGSLLPTIPKYVEDVLGGNGFDVGLVVGAFAVSAAIVRPWAGRLGDRYGRRVLLSGGALLVGVVTFAYTLVDAVAGARGPPAHHRTRGSLRVRRGGDGHAGHGARRIVAARRRPTSASRCTADSPSVPRWASTSLGPPAATTGCGRWRPSRLLAALLGLGTPTHHAVPTEKPKTLLYRAALGPGFVLMLGLIPFTGFAAFLAIYGPDIGLDDTAPVFFFYAGAVLLIRIFGAKLPDRLGWQLASTIALVAVGSGALVLALWASVLAVWVSAACLALGMSLLYPALFSAALDDVPDHERSQAVGTFSLFFDLSQGVGAPILGVVVALTGERARSSWRR